jgi:hypothetical protein
VVWKAGSCPRTEVGGGIEEGESWMFVEKVAVDSEADLDAFRQRNLTERCWVCDVRWTGDVRRKEGGAHGGARSFPMMQSLTTT